MGIFNKENAPNTETPVTKEDFLAQVDLFVSKQPQAVYLIDGKKDTNKSVICRKNENGGKTCLNLSIDGAALFVEMQANKYFCSLPIEIDATHFECRKINE